MVETLISESVLALRYYKTVIKDAVAHQMTLYVISCDSLTMLYLSDTFDNLDPDM